MSTDTYMGYSQLAIWGSQIPILVSHFCLWGYFAAGLGGGEGGPAGRGGWVVGGGGLEIGSHLPFSICHFPLVICSCSTVVS